jgi:hypothetical protein
MGRARRDPGPLYRRPGRDVHLAQPGRRVLAHVVRLLGELGLKPKVAKTRIVHLDVGGEGFDFLGFHHRQVRSRGLHGRRRVEFLARRPSNKAIQHARDPWIRGDHRPAQAPAAPASTRGKFESVPPRVDGVLPVWPFRPPLQQDRKIRAGESRALHQQEAPAQPELRLVRVDGLVSRPARTSAHMEPSWQPQGRKVLAGETEFRR